MKLRRTPTTGEPSREEPVEPDNFLGTSLSRKEYKKQLATTEILRNEAVLSGLLEMRKNLPGSNLLEIFIRTASSEIAEQRERYSRIYGEFKIYLEVEKLNHLECPQCGCQNIPNLETCDFCGLPLTEDMEVPDALEREIERENWSEIMAHENHGGLA